MPGPGPLGESVRELIALGYVQTSSRFRHLARLPPNMTGIEALRSVDSEYVSIVFERIEMECADTYRRVHAPKIELTSEEFAEYKRLLRHG